MTFNEQFWYADSVENNFVFIAWFDFEKGDFSTESDKGIILEGLPFSCLTFDCPERNNLKLYLSDKYEVLNDDFEKINEQQTKDLVKNNILNFGKDPTRSDSPNEATTELYLKSEHELSKIGPILKIVSDGYLELIESKKNEKKLTNEQLVADFPLRLHLRENITIKNDSRTIDLNDEREIESTLMLDTLELK